MPNLWNTIASWVNDNAQQYIAINIPRQRTDLTGPDDPLKPQRDYLRLWLDDMYLKQDRAWFTNIFPAVHTAIELKFGADPIKITHVTDGTAQVGHGSYKSYALTDLVPFNGGTVTVQSALVELKGRNYLTEAIGILKDFSGLVAAPLSQTLTIADKVATGMQSMFQKSEGEVVLGYHRQYAAEGGGGGAVLKPGYFVVILASVRDLNPDLLSVKDSQLLYAKDGGKPQPLEGYNYMLFRIEGRAERDNWRMANIEEPLNQAIQATVKGDDETAKGCLTAALLVIWQSPDLAVKDRRRVADAIKAELADVAGQPHGSVPAEVRTLPEIMQMRAMSVQQALAEPELSLAEILG